MSDDTSTANDTLRSLLDPRSMALRHKLGIVGLLGLAGLPTVLSPIDAFVMVSAFYFAIFTMSWDVVSGYTGQISFGHGVFFAVGGYTSALLNMGHGLDPVLSIPLGVVLAAVAGVVIGVPALRLRGPYLSLVTLVAPLILTQIFIVQSDIFGGELGLGNPDNFLGFGLGDAYAVYYIAFVLFAVILFGLLAITRSDAGSVFTAIREDEDAVSAAGLNPAKFKIMAFVLSAAVGGLGGAMFVHTPRASVSPDVLMSIIINVEVIIAAILGGMGTIVGAAIGGLLLSLLAEQLIGLDFVIPVLNTPVSEINFLVFALVTLALLFILPGGIVRWAVGIGGRVVERTTRKDVAADGGTTPLVQVYENYTEQLREITGRNDDER